MWFWYWSEILGPEIETVTRRKVGKISIGLYYIQEKKTKNIKVDGKSNLLSHANWLES